jgi:hypothetical protein
MTMTEDPIVDEVRKHRQENAARFGYDVRAIAEDARKREKSSGHRIVNLEAKGRKDVPSKKRSAPARSKR